MLRSLQKKDICVLGLYLLKSATWLNPPILFQQQMYLLVDIVLCFGVICKLLDNFSHPPIFKDDQPDGQDRKEAESDDPKNIYHGVRGRKTPSARQHCWAESLCLSKIGTKSNKNIVKVWKVSGQSGRFPDSLESFQTVWKVSGQSGKFPESLESFWTIKKFPESLESS